MKEFNIREFNRLCAELLGFKCLANDQYELPEMMTFSAKICLEDMQYHSDWNWIMSVVEKIVSLDILSYYEREYDSISETYKCKFYHKKGNFNIVAESKSEKDAVIDAVWQFLNWYNQNKSIS